MTNFIAVSGQSYSDVCVNTYQTMDYFIKLLNDNSLTDANAVPASSQIFSWDNNLLVDAQSNRKIELNNIKFATSYGGNTNTFYVVAGGAGNPFPSSGGGTVVAPAPIAQTYQKTSAIDYTNSTDGATSITFTTLIGKNILQIERNIQPLHNSEFTWTSSTGILTMVNPMMAGESLFILYTEMITI